MKIASYSRLHTFCLVACFTMGSAIIALPFADAAGSTVAALILALLVAAALAFLLLPPICAIFSERLLKARLGKILLFPVYAAAAAMVFLYALHSFSVLCNFVSANMLPQASTALIAAVFALCVLWASFMREGAILKFSLIAFILSCAVVIIFFFALLGDFDFSRAFESEITATTVTKEALTYLLRVFLPASPVILYISLNSDKTKKAPLSLGVALGGALLTLTLLSSIMLFGVPQATTLEYAFADAISTVSVGYLFTRMDGFAYFVFFATVLIKVTVCVLLITRLAERYKSGCRKAASTAAVILLFCFCLGSL